jgi:inward rectifier potassium channel
MKRSGDALSYSFQLVGGKKRTVQDLYHWFLKASWLHVLATIAAGFLLINLVFGLLFLIVGGIQTGSNRRIVDAFFFSVQTFGTIGYGHAYPESIGANALVTLESLTSVVFTALVTGLVFSKFSRPTQRGWSLPTMPWCIRLTEFQPL